MKTTRSYVLVLVTAPKLSVARNLAKMALSQKLIACANILPGVESHYWWKEKLELSRECLLILKTRSKSLSKLESILLELHPYDTPEIIVVPLQAGTNRYLDWLRQSTTSRP